MKYLSIIIVSLVCCITSCREKYQADLRSSDKSALVVDGFLNAGTGPTTITLTRSYALNSPGNIPKVTNAQVTVEGDNGVSFSLTELGASGVYRHPQLNLPATQQYRLRIKTADNKEYLSDYVPVNLSQPIDSVNWKWENNGVMFYVSTHDATNKSRYYKWEFEETWEIITNYFSEVKMLNDTTIVLRNLPAEDVSHCWKYDFSRTIMLGSTAQLQSDVAYQIPLYFLTPHSERLGVRYSTLVKQSVLTQEAHEYFTLMKKNTEQLGTVFDPLPSELSGNIKCLSDPKEQVIGYMTASSQTEKRVFITAQQVPESKFIFPNCFSILVPKHKDSIRKHLGTLLPYAEYRNQFNILTHYYLAPPVCSDCTTRGGANVKPSYW